MPGSTVLAVRHNIETAHRLSLLPGKCEAIHGHSMWVELVLGGGELDRAGLLAGLDFGSIKRAFRGHLDTEFDHRLLLNTDDPLIERYPDLPGLRRCQGDPSTENIAAWIGQWATEQWPDLTEFHVKVDETHVNAAVWSWMR